MNKMVLVLVLVATAATACGTAQKPPQITPAVPAVPETCWSLSQKDQSTDWFEDEADVPVMVTITEFVTVDGVRKQNKTICSGVLTPGPVGRRLGPAIWAHRTATTEWIVTGVYYISVVNSNRSEGLVDTRDIKLTYERNYGWHFAPVR